MRSPRLVLLLFLVSSYTVAYSQQLKDGYIIMPNGDYKYGRLNVSSSNPHETCQFIEAQKNDFNTYTPQEIAGYGVINESRFIAKEIQIDSKPAKVFLKSEFDDLVKLYSYHHRLFLEKGEFHELTSSAGESNYITILQKFLGDCKDLSRSITKTTLTSQDVASLLKKYNKCANNNYEMPPSFVLHFEPMAGLEINSTTLSSDVPAHHFVNGKKMTDETLLSVGANVRLARPNTKWLSVVTGIYFYQQEFYIMETYNTDLFIHRDKMNFDYTEITIPINVQFSLIRTPKNVDPYVKGGICIPYVIKSSLVWQHEVEDYSSIYFEKYELSKTFNESIQINVALGTYITFTKRVKGIAEISYHNTGGTIALEENSIDVISHRVNILVGLRF